MQKKDGITNQVELNKKGFSRKQIAELFGVSPASVKTWIAMHRNGQEDLLDLLVDRPYEKAYSYGLKLEAVQAHLRDGRSLSEVTV